MLIFDFHLTALTFKILEKIIYYISLLCYIILCNVMYCNVEYCNRTNKIKDSLNLCHLKGYHDRNKN